MANVNRIRGLVPARHMHGGMFAVGNEYVVAASNTIVVGDVVELSTESDANGVMKVATLSHVSTAPPLGVCIGVQPVDRTGKSGSGASAPDLNIPASTVATAGDKVIVCDDPQVIYEATVTGALTSAMFGANAAMSLGTYNTVTGASNHYVNVSSTATTATMPVKLLGMVRNPKNEVGDLARVFVKLNGAQLGDGTGTVGK